MGGEATPFPSSSCENPHRSIELILRKISEAIKKGKVRPWDTVGPWWLPVGCQEQWEVYM